MRKASPGRKAAVLAALPLMIVAACGGSDDGGGGGGSEGGDQSDAGPYRLGLVHSSEGPFATNSDTMRAGARYAVELINADGGVNGRDVELVEVDARNDPQTLVTAIPELVSEEEVFAIVAPVDSAGCEIACAIAADLQVPIVSAGAGRPGVLEPSRPWSFTMTAPDAANSIPVLEAVMEQEGAQTAAIIVDEANATTKAQGDLYAEVFDGSGVEVVSTTTYTSGDPSFTSQVTSMAAENPDVIALAAGPADAARIAVEVRTQGLESLLIGTGSLQAGGTDYINGAGEAAEGTITAAQFNPDNPDDPAATLLAQAEEDNGLDVVALNFSYAFDIVNMIAEYLTETEATASPETIEEDRQGLLDYLEGVDPYEGMSGDVRFAEDGTGDRPELYAVVENGQFVISEVGS
ncbi:MAG: ABC transporter substrate-binding protein [Geodermatophilaceae bacterium]|nr:ABC transporter substrate-binding protein [Geodermatophilaceae bacterium]